MSAPEPPDVDQMCPNCVTPWKCKCNGPHLRTDGQWQPIQYPDLDADRAQDLVGMYVVSRRDLILTMLVGGFCGALLYVLVFSIAGRLA